MVVAERNKVDVWELASGTKKELGMAEGEAVETKTPWGEKIVILG